MEPRTIRIEHETTIKIEKQAVKQKRTFGYIVREMLKFAIEKGYFKSGKP